MAQFAQPVSRQEIITIPSFTLDSGYTLRNVPVAYTCRGRLNAECDNAIVICHALTGSADVGDWWKQMFEFENRALNDEKFFIIGMNTLGSPYGTASPITPFDGDFQNGLYGAIFPATTFADDARLQRLVLDRLGVKSLACVIGGSMGGMLALEYAYFGKDYVRSVIPIATTAMQSAWAIGWGESQRCMIRADAKFADGHYAPDDPPVAGLGAARMAAMLTYRSIPSFASRFGRKTMDQPGSRTGSGKQITSSGRKAETLGRVDSGISLAERSRDDSIDSGISVSERSHHGSIDSGVSISGTSREGSMTEQLSDEETPRERLQAFSRCTSDQPFYAMQSYLRYQGSKFSARFDANCYIHLTEKMDLHDISRYSLLAESDASSEDHLKSALGRLSQPALVIGVESDRLYTFEESHSIADGIPDSRFRRIDGHDGHDAFLIHSDCVNQHLMDFFEEVLPELM